MSDHQNLLLFQLNSRQFFALNVLKIKEIITYSALNQLPESNSAIAGVTELRGSTLPVIDLSVAVGFSATDTSSDDIPSIIVTECNGKTQGFLVRHVENIIKVDWRNIKALPKTSGKNHYAIGVINLDDKLVTLIDLEKIMHETIEVDSDFSNELLDKIQLLEIKDKTLLVIDDSLIARKKIASILDTLGLQYQLTHSANDALVILNDTSTPFDMIISDIEMPQMNGYEFSRKTRALANHHANTHILLHTSLTLNKNNKDFEQSKANALLTKFAPKALASDIYQGLTHR
jgi:two-component system chemotaxis response regulator CheV